MPAVSAMTRGPAALVHPRAVRLRCTLVQLGYAVGRTVDRAGSAAAFFNGEFVPGLGAEFRGGRIKVLEQCVQEVCQFFGGKVREYFFRSTGVIDEMGQL